MTQRFRVIETPLRGLALLERRVLTDDRGFLERLYCERELRPLIGERRIVQITRTSTVRRGTVRGLHFQVPPHAETKIVSCLRGEAFDVAVDLRAGSPTFLQWHAATLSSANATAVVIPEGFAHGLQTLTDECEMLYFHTAFHEPESERGLDAEDPRLGIEWPLPVLERSPRDRSHPRLDDGFTGITT
ncbi:MAG: dTDP-4-dehydrorhamnose 3,5-epimerase family protein [Thermoanaerobaculia bacterium]